MTSVKDEQALVPVEVRPPVTILPTKDEWTTIISIANQLGQHAKDLLPRGIDTPGKVLAVALKGREIGVPPMAALAHMFVVNGKVDMDAQLMMGVIRARDPRIDFEWLQRDEQGCRVLLHRPGKQPVEGKYTQADAIHAGQWDKEVWKKFPKDMLAWAAVKRACRFGAPEYVNALTVTMFGEFTSEEPIPEDFTAGELLRDDANGSEQPVTQATVSDARQIAEPPPKPQPPIVTEEDVDNGESFTEEEIAGQTEEPTKDNASAMTMTKEEFDEQMTALGITTPHQLTTALKANIKDWINSGRSYEEAYRVIVEQKQASLPMP